MEVEKQAGHRVVAGLGQDRQPEAGSSHCIWPGCGHTGPRGWLRWPLRLLSLGGEVVMVLNSSPHPTGFPFRAPASGEGETTDKYSSGPEAGGPGPGASTQQERAACC